MAESDIMEDQAARYVLGELGETQRREFEARLEKSAELRAVVRALEAGATALTLATPQHEPPPMVWQRIEETVSCETNRKRVSPPFWSAWLCNGWAAATACLLGWSFYALWVNRPGMDVAPTHVASVESSDVEASPTNPVVNATALEPRRPAIATNTAQSPPQMSLAALGQIAGLRSQVTELETQVSQLSQVLAEQQALLAEPNRLKFFHLLPTEFGGTGTNMPPPAPALQRALLLAVARELGWLRSDGTSSGADIGVDFVDLPFTGTNHAITTQSANSTTQQDLAATTEPNPDTFLSSTSPSAIPGYVLPGTDGNSDVVFALDSTVLGSGTASFSLWGQRYGTDGLMFLGTLGVMNYPQVITVHGMDSVGISVGNNFLYGPANFNSISPALTNAP